MRARIRKWTFRGAVVLLVIAAGSEIFARFGLGLGDPPLMMADAQIEYLAQPSMSYTRRGHRISYNQWSMRSDEFSHTKSNPHEFRLMVLGDSVVNGGSQIDQASIATQILQRDLAVYLKRPVVVGNISAASWGPPNLLAYVQRFGLFEADAVVIVLSSHDASDVPTFEPLGPDAPRRTPVLALQEVVQRYLPRYLPGWLSNDKPQPEKAEATRHAEEAASLAALNELLTLCKSSGSKVVVAQHLEQCEIADSAKPGHHAIAQLVDARGIERILLGPAFAQAIKRGEQPYRDDIHPNAFGQQLIAESLLDWLRAGDDETAVK